MRMISAANPMECPMNDIARNVSRTVNVTFDNGRKCVSLSLDNSLGRMDTLRRGDIRLFVDKDDVTGRVFRGGDKSNIYASLENFETAMMWLKRTEWGMCSVL
jgi:hypothetical protein